MSASSECNSEVVKSADVFMKSVLGK